jgi:hypothetical protein
MTGKKNPILILYVLSFLIILPTQATPDDEEKISITRTDTQKWLQEPDESKDGIDIRCDNNDGTARALADDFVCSEKGLITTIRFWGGWKGNTIGNITEIQVGFYSDDVSSSGYHMPGELQGDGFVFYPDGITATKLTTVPKAWFWDIYNDIPRKETDHDIWEYEMTVGDGDAFCQKGETGSPITYWLVIWVMTEDPDHEFGWKTSEDQNGSNAVWYDTDYLPDKWTELEYPPVGFTNPGGPIDLAFELTSKACSYCMEPDSIPAQTGGSVIGYGDAGEEHAERGYVVLGSSSGYELGFQLPGIMTMPLNYDWFTEFVMANLNTFIFMDFLGTTDIHGQFSCTFNCPPLPPIAIGLNLYFAYTLYNPFDFVSNPVKLTII